MTSKPDSHLFIKNKFRKYILRTSFVYPGPGKVVAHHEFKPPYPSEGNDLLFALAYMDLLIRGVYPLVTGFTKFTPIIAFFINGCPITTALSIAVKLTYDPDPNGKETPSELPKELVYKEILDIIALFLENYPDAEVTGVSIKAYSTKFKTPAEADLPSLEESDQTLLEILVKYSSIKNMRATPSIPSLRKAPYIKKKKPPKKKKATPSMFMVADIETLGYPMGKEKLKSHLPYAAGYMVVRPGREPVKGDINRYYSEDYKPILADPLERSTKLLRDMVDSIISVARKHRRSISLYFHNMARFDGILILRHLVLYHEDLHIEHTCRNSRIYEITVYSISGKNNRKRLMIRILDSCLVLPAKLEDLAVSFCPKLKGKGEIRHKSVNLDNLGENRRAYLSYLDQDILLLGHIVQRAQEIYLEEYNIDIVSVMTISALAMSIFRTTYYDDEMQRICIPNQNADQFIRSGFYGGHADQYIPYGEDLKLYDVNSLYPSVMESCEMPGGPPFGIVISH